MSEDEPNKFTAMFLADMNLYTDIEKILQQHNVKCSDWIGLVLLKRFDHKMYEYAEGYLKACLDILTALQRGRGGKG